MRGRWIVERKIWELGLFLLFFLWAATPEGTLSYRTLESSCLYICPYNHTQPPKYLGGCWDSSGGPHTADRLRGLPGEAWSENSVGGPERRDGGPERRVREPERRVGEPEKRVGGPEKRVGD